MNENELLIKKFYSAFKKADPKTMCECYHNSIQFEDPAFGKLSGNEACEMWKMLIDKSKGNLKIEFSDIKADAYTGSAKWVATYNFSKTKRLVINEIYAQFQFSDGLIVKHTDNFDIWKWSRQALGIKGLLLGWTSIMKKQIQKQAIASLKKYTES